MLKGLLTIVSYYFDSVFSNTFARNFRSQAKTKTVTTIVHIATHSLVLRNTSPIKNAGSLRRFYELNK